MNKIFFLLPLSSLNASNSDICRRNLLFDPNITKQSSSFAASDRIGLILNCVTYNISLSTPKYKKMNNTRPRAALMPYSFPMHNRRPPFIEHTYTNQASRYYQPQQYPKYNHPRPYNPRPSVNFVNVIFV
jgi:hypothetical protein